MTTHRQALVLLGPTGSGKTPLGDMLQQRGLRGTRCVHFDFGENLRQVVARSQPDSVVSPADIEFLRDVLATGALLEDDDFPLAMRILQSFLVRSQADADTIVVLNGLPRHIGQARSLDVVLDMQTVVLLECTADIVLQRIAANTGGDRTDRCDDDLSAIRRKLEIYARRTEPLVDHFRAAGAMIIQLPVTVAMTTEAMWQALQSDTVTR